MAIQVTPLMKFRYKSFDRDHDVVEILIGGVYTVDVEVRIVCAALNVRFVGAIPSEVLHAAVSHLLEHQADVIGTIRQWASQPSLMRSSFTPNTNPYVMAVTLAEGMILRRGPRNLGDYYQLEVPVDDNPVIFHVALAPTSQTGMVVRAVGNYYLVTFGRAVDQLLSQQDHIIASLNNAAASRDRDQNRMVP